nr:MAG TPA_asm: hypothetical protein [Caudoviricetes sp.]DAQ88393.1 MAG TPA: hypothetical protein [Caudoviricetes sp.]DAY89182.1 MAG TPA: hypothetical protein [Caudoviricetes sp.]
MGDNQDHHTFLQYQVNVQRFHVPFIPLSDLI